MCGHQIVEPLPQKCDGLRKAAPWYGKFRLRHDMANAAISEVANSDKQMPKENKKEISQVGVEKCVRRVAEVPMQEVGQEREVAR